MSLGVVPVEFVLFACVLAGVALFHRHALPIAVTGAALIAVYKIALSPFKAGAGVAGFATHLGHEWVILSNLLLLLLGFALLADLFEKSEVPAVLPRFLPDDWKGCFALLAAVFVLSSFLDNIAAAMIGGAVAHTVFRGKVHIGFLAAIVAASNGGGAGSVVGDTTTTMMWIAGVSPLQVLEGFIGSGVALLLFGIPAAIRQQAYSPIRKDSGAGAHVDPLRVGIVIFILAAAIAVNVVVNTRFTAVSDSFPFLGAAVWAAILPCAVLRRPNWSLLPGAARGAVFLLSLVLGASMMPVEQLPAASWPTALGLGFVSAVFDNIPLTALALKQGGYDWGFLAYAVGFGGSMLWFGSSAGVALSSMFPQARSVGPWLRHGWPIIPAYVAGYFVMLAVLGFHPDPPRGPALCCPPWQDETMTSGERLQVLVARAVFPEVIARLRVHFDVEDNAADVVCSPAQLTARLQGKAGALTTGSERIDAALLAACPQLRAVCNVAVGYNNFDIAACTAAGVLATNTPDVLTETTADFGFALMMATARRIAESEHFLRRGAWTKWAYDMFSGSDVHGATLAILGMGRIGQAIARRGVLGFGMKLIYHNRSRLPADAEAALNARYVDKPTLLAQADHLVLVLPYSAESHHAIGAAELALMKPGATLTNIARGGIIDDAALAAALRERRIAAAGLDVFEGEPAVHPDLLTVPNVVLTPHIASASVATRRAMAELAADNLIAALTGGVPPTPINAEVLKHPRAAGV